MSEIQLSASLLLQSCHDTSRDDAITIRTHFEPVAGFGAPIKPAIYEGGKYQEGSRWLDAEDKQATPIIVIDNEASQANRLEAALSHYRTELGLPHFVLDFGSLALPPHLPKSLSSMQFPHRNADAYLRDALLEGIAFQKSEIGKAVFDATADLPEALLQWVPTGLLYGFWQSHLGKKGSQAKLARCWTSQLIGISPASTEITTNGTKGDPYNLSIANQVVFDANEETGWSVSDDLKKGKAKGDTPAGEKLTKERLSEIGHGQVPFDTQSPAAVSFKQIIQTATVSFAALRRITCTNTDQSAHARAVLASLGIAAHTAAFGRAVSLRSGCDLRATSTKWSWLSPTGDQTITTPTFETALAVFQETVGAAEKEGLNVGSKWRSETLLTPNEALAKVVTLTWPEGN